MWDDSFKEYLSKQDMAGLKWLLKRFEEEELTGLARNKKKIQLVNEEIEKR